MNETTSRGTTLLSAQADSFYNGLQDACKPLASDNGGRGRRPYFAGRKPLAVQVAAPE
ncbi:MAG: hypothetical protein ACOY16_00275 [Chloroflexota bacterium]